MHEGYSNTNSDMKGGDYMNGLSAADVMAISNNTGNGSQDMWLLLILILFAGGNGLGGNSQAVTQTQLQNGFDTQAVTNKLNGLENGLCDGFFSINNSIKDSSFATQQGITNLGYSIQSGMKDILFSQKDCCCETNRNIDSVKFENEKNTCRIIENQTAQTQRVIDFMTEQKISKLEQDNLFLRLKEASSVSIDGNRNKVDVA